MAISSEHSLTEVIGPPPPAVTEEQEQIVRGQIERAYPSDSPSDRTAREELVEILFSKPNYRTLADLPGPVSFQAAREALAARKAAA